MTNKTFQVIKTRRVPAPNSYLRTPSPGKDRRRQRARRVNIEKKVLQNLNDTYVTPQVEAIASQFFTLLRKVELNNEEDDDDDEVGMESVFGLEGNNQPATPQSSTSPPVSTGTDKRNLDHVDSTTRWVGDGVLNDELERINYGKVCAKSINLNGLLLN